MKNDFFAKKMQFFPLPPPSECPLRGVAAALRPAEGRDAGPPPPADVPLIESFFFLPDFFASVRRFPPVVLQTDAPPVAHPGSRRPLCPIYIGVGQSADCLHAPPLRPFLPTNAISRTKQHRGTPETPYPGPKQTARRWKCRIFNLSKCFDARHVVSLTFQNVLMLDMSYI